MTGGPDQLGERAAALRLAFDRTFAEVPRHIETASEDLLAIRIGADPYALRLGEIAGVFAGRRVSPAPSGVRGFLGIAGLRGAILPVYDLHVVLGYPPAAAARWLVVAAQKPVAFAFAALDGHLRLGREAIATEADDQRQHVREIARSPEARPLIRLASVLDAVERLAHPLKEH